MESVREFSGCTISSYDCKCFDKLSAEDQKYIEQNSVTIKYKKGESICKQGGYVSQIMYVKKGLAKVFIDNGTNSLLLRITPEGSFIGLSAISDEFINFPYSAKVYIDSVITQIDINAFRAVLNRNISFANEIIKILSANSIQIYGRFFCLTYKQAYGRLADIVLCLAERIFKQDEFQLPLSRKDIAELSGMSTETVVRMLKKFSDDGLIQMDGKKIEILNVAKLHHISEIG